MTDIALVKQLRSETGHSIGKCKEALENTNGDLEKAREVLRERGAITAQKKADRELNAGVVEAYIHTTRRTGAMVELLCETDFVARNEEFITLARDLAMHSAAFQPQYVSKEQVPSEVIANAKAELQEGIDKAKPAELKEKILEGMLEAKLSEVVLLEQKFLKDDTRNVREVLEEAVQKFGERLQVGRIAVWVL